MARYEELNRRLEKHQATDMVCPFFPMKQMTSNDLTIRREGGSLQFCRPVLQLAVGFLVPHGMDLLRKPRVFLKLMNMTMPNMQKYSLDSSTAQTCWVFLSCDFLPESRLGSLGPVHMVAR